MTPLDTIPVDDTTRPDAETVHLTRWQIERMKRQSNARDAERALLSAPANARRASSPAQPAACHVDATSRNDDSTVGQGCRG